MSVTGQPCVNTAWHECMSTVNSRVCVCVSWWGTPCQRLTREEVKEFRLRKRDEMKDGRNIIKTEVEKTDRKRWRKRNNKQLVVAASLVTDSLVFSKAAE